MRKWDSMRVLLIRPPSILDHISKENIQHPINLAQLAAELLKGGIDVRIFDYEVKAYNKKDFAVDIEYIKPDLIGFTSVTPHIVKCADMAGFAKSILPKVHTVVGGPHSSVLPAQTLKEFPSFDLVVIGEGERTLLSLCWALQNRDNLESLKGIAFRQDAEVFVNLPNEQITNLNDLQIPSRNLLPLKDYFRINRFKGVSSPGISRNGINSTQIFTSRGCWGECLFCSYPATLANPAITKKIRIRSLEHIKIEVEQCIRDFHINHFSIEDEMFPSNKKILRNICDLFGGLDVTWNCNARVDILNKNDLHLMAKSGCLKLELGVESGSPRILSLLKKNISPAQIENVFAWAKEAGIWRTAYLMIGSHPTENESDIELTKKLVKKIKPDLITYTMAVPYPGTGLKKMMDSHGLIDSYEWENFQYYNSIPSWRTFNMTPHELVKQQSKFLRWFYLRPSFIFRKFAQIRSLQQMFYFIAAGFNTLVYLLVRRKKKIGK